MKHLLKKSILTIMLLSTILFINCESENLQINEEEKVTLTEANFEPFLKVVEANFTKNISFIDEFIIKHKSGNLDKASMMKMLKVLNISKNMNLEELKVANQKTKINELMEFRKNNAEPISKTETCQYDNIANTQSKSESRSGGMCARCCNRLVEIRDAMIDECNQYVWGLDQVCSGSVMMAYWYKSRHC